MIDMAYEFMILLGLVVIGIFAFLVKRGSSK